MLAFPSWSRSSVILSFVLGSTLVLKFPFLMSLIGLEWYWMSKGMDFDFLEVVYPPFFVGCTTNVRHIRFHNVGYVRKPIFCVRFLNSMITKKKLSREIFSFSQQYGDMFFHHFLENYFLCSFSRCCHDKKWNEISICVCFLDVVVT